MRIVDVSTMLGPWPFQQLEFETAEDLIKKMDLYGIDEAYAYSSYSVKTNPVDGNYMLADQIKGYEKRIKPCWVVIPTWDIESPNKLEDELKKYDVRLVRMFPTEHQYSVEPWVCDDLYEMLQRNHIPVLFNGTDITPGQVHSIASAYPELPIILTQCDYGSNRNLYKLFAKHPNVYLEVATYYIYDGLEDMAKKFGAERMIFGTRMPFQEGAASLGMTLLSDLSDEEKEKIFSGNIDRLINGVRV